MASIENFLETVNAIVKYNFPNAQTRRYPKLIDVTQLSVKNSLVYGFSILINVYDMEDLANCTLDFYENIMLISKSKKKDKLGLFFDIMNKTVNSNAKDSNPISYEPTNWASACSEMKKYFSHCRAIDNTLSISTVEASMKINGNADMSSILKDISRRNIENMGYLDTAEVVFEGFDIELIPIARAFFKLPFRKMTMRISMEQYHQDYSIFRYNLFSRGNVLESLKTNYSVSIQSLKYLKNLERYEKLFESVDFEDAFTDVQSPQIPLRELTNLKYFGSDCYTGVLDYTNQALSLEELYLRTDGEFDLYVSGLHVLNSVRIKSPSEDLLHLKDLPNLIKIDASHNIMIDDITRNSVRSYKCTPSRQLDIRLDSEPEDIQSLDVFPNLDEYEGPASEEIMEALYYMNLTKISFVGGKVSEDFEALWLNQYVEEYKPSNERLQSTERLLDTHPNIQIFHSIVTMDMAYNKYPHVLFDGICDDKGYPDVRETVRYRAKNKLLMNY